MASIFYFDRVGGYCPSGEYLAGVQFQRCETDGYRS
jgi:hypothetical protein